MEKALDFVRREREHQERAVAGVGRLVCISASYDGDGEQSVPASRSPLLAGMQRAASNTGPVTRFLY